jgi:hypothetical protein
MAMGYTWLTGWRYNWGRSIGPSYSLIILPALWRAYSPGTTCLRPAHAIYAAGGVVDGKDAQGKVKPGYNPTGYKIQVP